ncbi:MAG: CDP-glucose 4,6-dehydratase [Lachnospiraceae bacterium]|nr:CDP-glucose 4,6-dehydratase [Lachnospiraceae bacterium]
MDFTFYKDRKVLITGHTGFKGSWMCRVLENAGARIFGYALESPTDPALFQLCRIGDGMQSRIADIRDFDRLKSAFDEFGPEIVIHMAAQPIVRTSYKEPRVTYETNVMGTVNVLECCRLSDTVRSVVNVTTDKVYRNEERNEAFREEEYLDGYDPYSNSKSCSELVTSSYRNAFLKEKGIPVSTCRAGNVIGGGDFAKDRIVPDCYRAASKGESIIVRNPHSVRPYQHVLEPVCAYLEVAKRQYEDPAFSGAYNIGPDEESIINTGRLTDLFCEKWEKYTGKRPEWIDRYDGGPHEAGCLKLDNRKVKETFGIKPRWNIDETLGRTVEWYAAFSGGGDMIALTDSQIREFLKDDKDTRDM